MNAEALLRVAYGFNVLVLLPVLIGLAGHRGTGLVAALGGEIVESAGLRWLVIALWSGVAIASTMALFKPRLFVGLLIFQVIYKAVFLAAYVAPLIVRGEWAAVPVGPAAVFAVIVVVWPFVIVRALA